MKIQTVAKHFLFVAHLYITSYDRIDGNIRPMTGERLGEGCFFFHVHGGDMYALTLDFTIQAKDHRPVRFQG